MNEKLLKIKSLLSSLIADEPETAEVEMEAVTSDKAVLYIEKIEVGESVEVGDENGENRTPAEDGDYVLTDGRTLKVADGKISEIVEAEAEEEEKEDEVETALSKYQKVVQKNEESYDEKMKKIADAIRATGMDDFWIVEAGDDYAIVDVWDDEAETSKYNKYSIVWSEEGEPTVTLEGEVVSAFIPKEVKEEIEDPVVEEHMEEEPEPAEEPEVEERDLAKELDELKAVVDGLKEKLEGIEKAEVKTPEQEFEAIKDTSKMSRAEQIAAALRK